MLCKLAVFDLDGTILNTIDDLAASVNAALRASGFPERSVEDVRRFVGNGIRKTLVRSAPEGISESAVDRLYADFTTHYQLHNADRTQPYPGIPELLTALQSAGIKTAVVSNKVDSAAAALCTRFFPGMFDAVVGERENVPRKPAPDSVYAVLDQLCTPADQAVYVGDSEVDIQTARNAGLREILVAWGFKGRTFLDEQGARCIVDAPAEIAALLISQDGGSLT